MENIMQIQEEAIFYRELYSELEAIELGRTDTKGKGRVKVHL